MFSLFGKKDIIRILDIVYLTNTAKWNACLTAVTSDPSTIFLAWFPDTLQQLQAYFNQHSTMPPNIFLCRNANSFNTKDKKIIFIEH